MKKLNNIVRLVPFSIVCFLLSEHFDVQQFMRIQECILLRIVLFTHEHLPLAFELQLVVVDVFAFFYVVRFSGRQLQRKNFFFQGQLSEHLLLVIVHEPLLQVFVLVHHEEENTIQEEGKLSKYFAVNLFVFGGM